MTTPKHLISLIAALGCACISHADTIETSVSTVPVGYFTVNIAGGSTAAPATTRFSVPLVDSPLATGIHSGPVSEVSATALTLAEAGWSAGALATAEFPYAVRILTGAQAGLTLRVTANTAETLSVLGVDLVGLGVVAGDRVQLVPVDTLNTLFGSDTLLGGPNAASADVVHLGANLLLAYYYNTNLGRWVRTTGPTTDRGNVVIMPESVIHVSRVGGATALTFTGRVPETPFIAEIANTGSTYTHAGFPTDTTLGSLALQTRIDSWVSASSASLADQLWLPLGGTWVAYYHNGSQWLRTTGPALNRDAISIPAGSPILISRQGYVSGVSRLSRPLPYTLD